MDAGNASETILLDFQTATRSSAWKIVNDDVMGGMSTSRFQPLTNGGALFSGVVSLENNGGFASVRCSPVRENLDGCAAFVLRVRGDGKRYQLTVRTETSFDAPVYHASFTTTRDVWEEHRLALNDFVPMFRGRLLTNVPPINPARIASVGILISERQAGRFHLEISWIKAARR